VVERNEGELTVDGDADSDSRAGSGGQDGQAHDAGTARPEDRVAERFLELESQLAAGEDSTLPDGTVRAGRLVDAELVPAATAPETYPVDLGAGQALALAVELDGGRQVTAYLDWPAGHDPEESSTLGRLLAGMDIAPEQLAELYGRRVLVEVVDGHYSLYLPDEQPRGTGRNRYGVLAGALGSLATLAGLALAPSGLTMLLFLLVTLVVLPLFTYRDAWYLRTHSDWEGGPAFWATLAMIPGVNLLSTALYLLARGRATYLTG